MRIFVTGASGYIGSAVTRELLDAGHTVTGLVRSDASEQTVRDLGADTLRGNLTDPAGFRSAVHDHEAVIHTAMDYQADTAAVDRAATEAFLEAGRGILVYTSGCWALGETGDVPADETTRPDHPFSGSAWRVEVERVVLDRHSERLATAVIRPGMVYGEKRGLVTPFFRSAVETGAAEYIGSGRNRWVPIHRQDLARLYRRILEAGARGVFHGVDARPTPVIALAEAASRAAGKGGATRSVPVGEARERWGPMVEALLMDQVLVAPRARQLGWKPERASFAEAAEAAFREFRG